MIRTKWMKSMKVHIPRLVALCFLAIFSVSCDSDSGDHAEKVAAIVPQSPTSDDRIAEPWILKPKSQWPQIVLTNHAEFIDHSSLHGASSFLIKTSPDRVLAATARHLLGPAGGVEPEISVSDLPEKIKLWRMFPRTLPAKFVEISSLGSEGLDDVNLDWLILSIKDSSSMPAHPLKIRKEPVRIGESVYLIGCPYNEEDCKQNVYTGTVTERAFGDRFRYDIEPSVDIRGFSGAPIIDTKGYVVGVMTVWFEPKMSGSNFLEAGGEDIASIYESVMGRDK